MQDLDYSNFEPVGAEAPTFTSLAPVGVDLSILDDTTLEVAGAGDAGGRVYRLLSPIAVRCRQAVIGEPEASTISEIRMRHAVQAEIDAWGRGEISRRELLCLMAGQPRHIIGALSWPDSEALHRMFSDMVPDFILTSEG